MASHIGNAARNLTNKVVIMAATPKQTQPLDAMVIDAIDHIALCIADSINDLPEEEREKQRNELVKTFADGLLLKAKAAENRHQQVAKDSLNLYIAYVKPSREDRRIADIMPPPKENIPDSKQEPVFKDDHIKKFLEMKVKLEEEKCERAGN